MVPAHIYLELMLFDLAYPVKPSTGSSIRSTVSGGVGILRLSEDGNTSFPSHIAHLADAKNHKPPTFSRKIRGLCLLNVAVKERFELSIQFLVYTLSRRAP